MSAPTQITGAVLLFDGECGLCNRCVRGLLRVDRRGGLRFASLQSAVAQAYLRAHGLPTENFDSLVFVPEWGRRDLPDFSLRTNAVVAALKHCGGCAGVLGTVLGWVPSSWRDAGYKLVARWRYRLWGDWRPRPLAKPEWTRRFIA
ncbi:MAG: DUF393 domain-containing protein [Opitutaceae bacterium]|nr:DUF393 domain-containing protein [Opitutaceae bacterium]